MTETERARRNASGLTTTSPHFTGLVPRHAAGQHWQTNHMAEARELVEAFTSGTSYRELAERFDIDERTVRGVVALNLTGEQIDQAIAVEAQALTAATIGKMNDLLPEAGMKEFGALAIQAKIAFELSRAAKGEASSFSEPAKPRRSVADFMKASAKLVRVVDVEQTKEGNE
jgi:hypothetical protein